MLSTDNILLILALSMSTHNHLIVSAHTQKQLTKSKQHMNSRTIKRHTAEYYASLSVIKRLESPVSWTSALCGSYRTDLSVTSITGLSTTFSLGLFVHKLTWLSTITVQVFVLYQLYIVILFAFAISIIAIDWEFGNTISEITHSLARQSSGGPLKSVDNDKI